MARKARARLALCAEISLDGKLLDWSPRGAPPEDGGDEADIRSYEFFFEGASSILFFDELPSPLPMARSVKQILCVPLLRPGQDGPPAEWARDMRYLLEWLWNERPGDAVCFGGPELFRTMLAHGVADELRLIVRPRIDGRRDAPTLSGPAGADFFSASVACRLLSAETRDGRCFMRYHVLRRRALRA